LKKKTVAEPQEQEVELSIPGLDPLNNGAPESGFVLVVEGPEASGKSLLSVQGPSPIAYFSFNAGADRVVPYAREELGKVIHLGSYERNIPKVEFDRSGGRKMALAKDDDWWIAKGDEIMRQTYRPFLETWEAAYREPQVRTMVQDRCDEIWDVAQLANFGKRQANMQLAYGPVSDEYLQPIKAAKMAGKMVVLIHETRQSYQTTYDDKGREKREIVPGKFYRGGHNQVGAAADAIVRMHYIEAVPKRGAIEAVEARFEVEVIRAKRNMGANGDRFEMPKEGGLYMLMSEVLAPKSDPGLWL
jgi:hypothetical protein